MNHKIITKIPGLLMCLCLISNVNAATTVTINNGALQVEGLRWATPPASALYKLAPGPLPGITGITSREQSAALTGTLDATVQQTGAISFWFATDRAYQTGAGQPKVRHELITVDGSFSISLKADKSMVTLATEWGGPPEAVASRNIQIILPEFPGPAWHHFAFTWNGNTGETNAYLNGTPYYAPGDKLSPFAVPPGSKLTLHLGALALADVRLDSKPLTPAALETLVPPEYKGRLDRLLGACDLGSITDTDAAALRGEVLYESSLASPRDVEGWVMEGPAITAHRDGWMEMKSQRPDGPIGHIVHWCPQKFPGSFVAEWDFEILSDNGLCIVFFSAWGKGGKSIFDPSLKPRNGTFGHYTNGDINCYHISYFAYTPNQPRGVSNLRKNSGFHVVSNGPIGVLGASGGRTHKAVLVKDGARIRMAVDGRVIIDYVDDGQRAGPVWEDGCIGLRQMQWTHGRYRNFKVSALRR